MRTFGGGRPLRLNLTVSQHLPLDHLIWALFGYVHLFCIPAFPLIHTIRRKYCLRIIGWLGLEGTLKIVEFQHPWHWAGIPLLDQVFCLFAFSPWMQWLWVKQSCPMSQTAVQGIFLWAASGCDMEMDCGPSVSADSPSHLHSCVPWECRSYTALSYLLCLKVAVNIAFHIE